MRRHPTPTKPLDLGKYTTGREVLINGQDWQAICQAQRDYLVSIRVVTPSTAMVRITDSGIMNLALGAVE